MVVPKSSLIVVEACWTSTVYTYRMASGRDGFTCKACGHFFSDAEILKWNTKWETIAGEKWLMEVIAECPHCGETRSYSIPGDVAVNFD